MTTALHRQIQDRLLEDTAVDQATITLVDAACTGDSALADALSRLDSSAPTAEQGAREGFGAPAEKRGVYLSSLKVSGFRGVGPERTLEVTPGPGLTLLVGRNGCGKSSFSEALETLLTGDSKRWEGRNKEWKEGWKNLHAKGGPYVEATFAVEGSDPVVLRRVWSEEADLEDSELRVRRGTQVLEGLDALGWGDAVKDFRPFLTYAELGALLSKPSELYDSLKGILGLDEVTAASKRLANARKLREDRQKKVKDECKRLLQLLEQIVDEPRAQRCREAIKGRGWKLDVVADMVRSGQADDHDETAQQLGQLMQLQLPTLDAVGHAVTALRGHLGTLAELAGTSDAQNAQLAELLERALAYRQEPQNDCPVCGAKLAANWQNLTIARLSEAQKTTSAVRSATQGRDQCVRQLKQLIAPVPGSLKRAEEALVSSKLLELWEAWAEAPSDPMRLCDHAESKILDLHDELSRFQVQVKAKLDQRESKWRPMALQLAAWLAEAKSAEAASSGLNALKAAETWLKAVEEELRDAQFAPIARESQKIWALLRQQSNVDLVKIKLDGTGNRRRVALNVAVDGREGVAVSVMSQGELNALALSLFLPRMMLAESPFRFLIVDDPVQALDSHKVDGLARVLANVAKTRQVIVLSHDPRLLEATRRLQIDASVF